jgi:hypothetical protein
MLTYLFNYATKSDDPFFEPFFDSRSFLNKTMSFAVSIFRELNSRWQRRYNPFTGTPDKRFTLFQETENGICYKEKDIPWKSGSS